MNKAERNRLIRIYERKIRETVPIIYSAFAIALHEEGAKYEDILRTLARTQQLWQDSRDGYIDIKKYCSELTGVDIMTTYTAEENGEEGEKI